MTTNIEKVLYTAVTQTTGGRTGESRSSDGKLDIKLTPPGSIGPGTNPEQLFSAGWSACFIGAMGMAAGNLKVAFPTDHSVSTEVDLVLSSGNYSLQARLYINLPGVNRDLAKSIIEDAQQICPYSKAVRGNIKAEYILV